SLMHDREAAARPHDQLHLVLAPVEEHEHVTAERIVTERVPDLVGQAVERLAQARRLRREVNAHRARHQDHSVGLASVCAIRATCSGVALDSSMVTSPARITAANSVPTTVAGTNASLGRGASTRDSRRAQYLIRLDRSPWRRANAGAVSPLRCHASITERP